MHIISFSITLQDSPDLSLALKSERYKLKWTMCSPLPTEMYWANSTTINSIMYIGGGKCCSRMEMLNVYAYHLDENRWDCLPPLQQYLGIPVNITDKLTIIGGLDSTPPCKITNKVTTFSGNSWRNDIFPNLLIPRSQPAVVPHQSYIIVAGGHSDNDTKLSNIEVLDIVLLQWRIVNIHLPKPMSAPSATVCGESLVIVGFDTADNKRDNGTFLIEVDKIISQTKHTDREMEWSSLADAPYFKTALLPRSSLPIIVGGSDKQYKTINDITIYNDVTKSWKVVSSIPKNCVFPTVTAIKNVLIVAGGCGDATTSKSCDATSLSCVILGHLEEITA